MMSRTMKSATIKSGLAPEKIFAHNVRAVLRHRRKTQTWLSEESGMTRAHICKMLSCRFDIRLSSVALIAKSLRVELSDLLAYPSPLVPHANGEKKSATRS